jgi:hypothetical protein
VIVWHLLADPTVRQHDLGPGLYHTRVNAEPTKRNHVRQLEALGYKVTRRLTGIIDPPRDPAALRCTGYCRLPTHREIFGSG